MPIIIHEILKLLLKGFGGFIFCCAVAANGTVWAESNKSDSVAVYSKTSTHSNKVAALGRNDSFHIKMELLNGAERWCAVNNGSDMFIGYALCEQLEKLKKRAPLHKRIKPFVEKQKKDKPLKTKLPDNAEGISAPGLSVKDAETTPKTADNVSAALQNINSVNVSAETGIPISKKAIAMFFVTVFILITLLAFLVDIFKRNYSQIYSYFSAAQKGKADFHHTETEADHVDKAAPENVTDSAASKVGNELQGEQSEAGLSDINEPVEYQFWDCVVRKADSSAVNTPAKCQICGTVQPLSADLKCIECSSDMTYYIEVKKT